MEEEVPIANTQDEQEGVSTLNIGSTSNEANTYIINIYGGGITSIGDNSQIVTSQVPEEGSDVSPSGILGHHSDGNPEEDFVLENLKNDAKRFSNIIIPLHDQYKVVKVWDLHWTLHDKLDQEAHVAVPEILTKYPDARSVVITGPFLGGLTSLNKQIAWTILSQPTTPKYCFRLEVLSVTWKSIRDAVKRNYSDEDNRGYWEFIEKHQEQILFVLDMPMKGTIDLNNVLEKLPHCRVIVTVPVNTEVDSVFSQSDVQLCVASTSTGDLRTINERVFGSTGRDSENLISVLCEYGIMNLTIANPFFIDVVCNCWKQDQQGQMTSATVMVRNIVLGCMQRYTSKHQIADIETFKESLYKCSENTGELILSKWKVGKNSFLVSEFEQACPNYEKLCAIGLACKQDVHMKMMLLFVDPGVESFLAALFIKKDFQELNTFAFKPKFRIMAMFACGMASTSEEVEQVLKWIGKQKYERPLTQSLMECCFGEVKHMLGKALYIDSDTLTPTLPGSPSEPREQATELGGRPISEEHFVVDASTSRQYAVDGSRQLPPTNHLIQTPNNTVVNASQGTSSGTPTLGSTSNMSFAQTVNPDARQRQVNTATLTTEGRDTEEFVPGSFNWNYQDYVQATNGFKQTLGRGGEGDVSLGHRNGLELAVKRVEKLASFQREKRMRKCRDPFLLPVWDVVKSKNEAEPHLVIYPFMKNGNLFDAVVNGKIDIDYRKRIAIALDIVHAIKYLHSKGFVYRDFKSSNILLDADLNPRLGDYGVVKQLFTSDSTASTSGGITTTNLLSATKATEGYICPIYRTTKEPCPENDLWGLGVGERVWFSQI